MEFSLNNHGMIQPASKVCVQSCGVIVVMTSVVFLWPRERGGGVDRKDDVYCCRIRYQTHVNVCLERVSILLSSVKHVQHMHISVKRQCMPTYSANLNDSYESGCCTFPDCKNAMLHDRCNFNQRVSAQSWYSEA